MAKYQKVLIEQENVTSDNRGFRMKDPSIATLEQTKKGLSCFDPKRWYSYFTFKHLVISLTNTVENFL